MAAIIRISGRKSGVILSHLRILPEFKLDFFGRIWIVESSFLAVEMLFNSYVFLFVFLPLTLGGFYLLSSRLGTRAAKLWLVAASLVYYGWWDPRYVPLIVGSMLVNFWVGIWLFKTRIHPAGKKVLLTIGVTANLTLLGYYKYAHFFVTNANALLGTSWLMAKLILPLGISFFTFQQIAYLVDASRGEVCEPNLGDFALFVTFFPQLIAGPIVHHSEMMPQFARAETFRFAWSNLAVGLTIFIIGLAKKVLIADGLSGHVASVFQAALHQEVLHASDAWAGALAYSFQLYFDFSGYSDMAIGLGRMFGITLPINFNSPYKATGIVDFWRRWHQTLSRCLRDYLYIPLGGNRLGKTRRYLNLLATMIIGGLWHGAGWTFIVWGALHGFWLAVNHGWVEIRDRLCSKWALPAPWRAWASRCLTFALVVIGFTIFRASDLDDAGRILAAMFGCGPTPAVGAPYLLKSKLWFWLAGLLGLVWLAPNALELLGDHRPALMTLKGGYPAGAGQPRWRFSLGWACAGAVLLAIAILSLSRTGEFLYYNF